MFHFIVAYTDVLHKILLFVMRLRNFDEYMWDAAFFNPNTCEFLLKTRTYKRLIKFSTFVEL